MAIGSLHKIFILDRLSFFLASQCIRYYRSRETSSWVTTCIRSFLNVRIVQGYCIMSRRYNHNNSPLERIVYTKVSVNGKVQLVPLELYADGSVKRADE
jgi:hypothetical protein